MGSFHFTWPDVAMVALPTLAIVVIVGLKLYFTHRYEDHKE